MPLNKQCAVLGMIARKRLLINERVFRSIIDFSSIIKNRQFEKSSCRACKDADDKSDFEFFTGSLNRLCKVLLVILKAAMPVGAARKTGFSCPASRASSCSREQILRSVYVFPDPATPSTFKRSCCGNADEESS
jgi:hypothetical protein